MPNYGWAFTYRGDNLTLIKPLLFNSLYDAYWKTPDFCFRSSRSALKEKEYFQNSISERQKNKIIVEKITSSFLENFSSAQLLYASIAQNTDIKNSFEYYFPNNNKNSDNNPQSAKRKFGIFMRNRNHENNLLAFNKIGLVMNDSDKNLLVAGVEINQTNEAADYFDKKIRLYNMKKSENEKLTVSREENVIYAPFLSWVYHNQNFNKNGKIQENTIGIAGISEYSKEAKNYKIHGYYGYSLKNAFDVIAKVKYKRLEMRKLSAIEETHFSRKRVIFILILF